MALSVGDWEIHTLGYQEPGTRELRGCIHHVVVMVYMVCIFLYLLVLLCVVWFSWCMDCRPLISGAMLICGFSGEDLLFMRRLVGAGFCVVLWVQRLLS